jgi:hypothetical protein
VHDSSSRNSMSWLHPGAEVLGQIDSVADALLVGKSALDGRGAPPKLPENGHGQRRRSVTRSATLAVCSSCRARTVRLASTQWPHAPPAARARCRAPWPHSSCHCWATRIGRRRGPSPTLAAKLSVDALLLSPPLHQPSQVAPRTKGSAALSMHVRWSGPGRLGGRRP